MLYFLHINFFSLTYLINYYYKYSTISLDETFNIFLMLDYIYLCNIYYFHYLFFLVYFLHHVVIPMCYYCFPFPSFLTVLFFLWRTWLLT